MTIHIYRPKLGRNLCGQDLWDTRKFRYYASDCKLCREEYKLRMSVAMESDNIAGGRPVGVMLNVFVAADG